MPLFRSKKKGQSQLRDSLTILTWLFMRAEQLRADQPERADALDDEAYIWSKQPLLEKHLNRLDLDHLRAKCMAQTQWDNYQKSRI